MRKMPCVFLPVLNPDGHSTGRASPIVQPGCEWVAEGVGIATRKWDGTACAVIGGKLYARLDAKRGTVPPPGSIKCAPELREDEHGGKIYWIEVTPLNPRLKWHCEVETPSADGTYELIGPKVNNNPERVTTHQLKRHGDQVVPGCPRTFDGLRDLLATMDAEGLVFHHPDGVRMAKIRLKDFGLKRGSGLVWVTE
jgi:hypothetical protein